MPLKFIVVAELFSDLLDFRVGVFVLDAFISGIFSWIPKSLITAKEPSSLISNVASSWRVSLLMSSGELTLPLTTTNLAIAPQVLFLMVAMNLPLTGSSFWRAFNFVLLAVSVSFLCGSVYQHFELVLPHNIDFCPAARLHFHTDIFYLYSEGSILVICLDFLHLL